MAERPGGGRVSRRHATDGYGFIDKGQIPAYKLGRVIRLKREDVDAFLESQRITPGSLSHLYPPYDDHRAEVRR